MKSFNKILLLLLMSVSVASIFISCKKDDNEATPSIDYVRITKPESSDSLLVGAGQGQLIAIVGNNLQGAVEVWFNDQQSRLTPTYISNTSILVSVPTQIPTTITNKVKIVFKNGYELFHNFQVQISKPVINSMLSEYVNAGDVAVIYGDFLYDPVTVTFTGGATGTIVSRKDQELQVQVPANAKPGPITVKTNFGEVISNFWFRDNRNLLVTGDPHEGWWGTYLVTNPGANDPKKISGNYYRYRKAVKSWTWDAPEVVGGPAGDNPVHSKNIPNDAILHPEDYNVKFEINTMKPYNSNRIGLNVGLSAEDNDGYAWRPPYDSKGQWNTITIPYDDMVKAYKVKPTVNPNGYWTRILIFGEGDLDADISFDNLRIVPKVSK